MKHPLTLAIAIVATALSVPAQATLYNVHFTGDVFQTQGSTPSAVGATISGSFTLVGSSNGTIENFVIDGQSAPAGSATTAIVTPDGSTAIYQSQVSALATGGTVNETFALSLSALGYPTDVFPAFPANTAASSLLVDSSQNPGNIDFGGAASAFPSTFDYVIAQADGSFQGSDGAEYAYLTTLNVTTAPEPASIALLATSLVGFVAIRRRRTCFGTVHDEHR